LFEQRRLPVLYIYSNNDEVIDSRLSAEFAAMLGADADTTDIYDENCRRTEPCSKSGTCLHILTIVANCYTYYLYLDPFNSFFRTIWVSQFQKGRTILDCNEARDDGVAVASAGPSANHLPFSLDR